MCLYGKLWRNNSQLFKHPDLRTALGLHLWTWELIIFQFEKRYRTWSGWKSKVLTQMIRIKSSKDSFHCHEICWPCCLSEKVVSCQVVCQRWKIRGYRTWKFYHSKCSTNTAPSCCYIPRDGNCRWYFATEGDILTFNRRLYQDLKEHISVKYIKDLMENIRMICNIKIHLQKTRKKGNVMRSLRNMVWWYLTSVKTKVEKHLLLPELHHRWELRRNAYSWTLFRSRSLNIVL